MLIPFAPFPGPGFQAPPHRTTTAPMDSRPDLVKIDPALIRFAENIRDGSIPTDSGGRPLWDEETFSDSGKSEPSGARSRSRRGSLRPPPNFFGSHTPLGETTVGLALREYGWVLWNIRQHKAPKAGRARQIRYRAVAALGGSGTFSGQEFIRRCRITSRFTLHLARLQTQALGHFPAMHAPNVRREVENILGIALYSLTNGKNFEGATRAKLQRAVECSVQRQETNWLTFVAVWLWSKLWC